MSDNQLTERKKELLSLIIEKYVETAEPVGSHVLVKNREIELSGATVRNEMRELEEDGLLTHPHTSAGRIPTEAGYRYYVEHLMVPANPTTRIQIEMRALGRRVPTSSQHSKAIGRLVAEYLNNVVILRLERDIMYYTGLAYLFAQPEFRDLARMVNISSVFDECEERMETVSEAITDEEQVILIGKDNPLGHSCGAVAARFDREILMVIVGPLRMPYARAVGMLEYLRGIL